MFGNILTGGGIDYASGPYSVMFRRGYARAQLVVNITNDNLLESDETFKLTFNCNNPLTTTITILDDECKQ